MAVQSHHDVVNQSLSTDAHSSVDASVFNATSSAARVAGHQPPIFPPRNELPPAPLDNPPRAASDASGNVEASAGPNVRFDNSDAAALEEDMKRSLVGDGSVGSDTDTSKTDAVGMATKDGEGRENSSRSTIKKSASFKPVSVTKNFLAKAGSTAAPIKSSNGSEKVSIIPGGSPAPVAQSAPRPRLVAKSITGQKGALPRSSSTSGQGGQSGAPDPSQVWNKNRVQVATATPKHMTDEELRQQYGIQLASRPMEDTDSNQAKWADIDDEDDWAPETIEWNDGTKINLAETAANTVADNVSASDEKTNPEPEPEPPKAPTSQGKPSTIGPNPTVLKLGAASQQKPLFNTKSTSEKPTLVARPMVPAAVKSPWAPLPPVEKVSPVQVNPPTQNFPSRFGHRDPHGFDSMPPPAKEIEADDFSRFRDHPNGNQRELYVPQSGRYEPVNDARRGSVRKEGNFRQPAVLQRPMHGDRDQAGPAEPSPAFQTSRSQQDAQPWARRRGSSGASVENGRFGRRMSVGRSQDARVSSDIPGRRGSQLEHRDASPSDSHGLSAVSHSPSTSTAGVPAAVSGQAQDQTLGAPAPPSQVTEDLVTMQKRLMREKREAAVKRRKEEEAREEAEKRERIRQKMEKLGMPTDNKPNEKKAVELESKAKESTERSPAATKAAIRENKDTRPGLPGSPPKPPIPSPSGEPQQYGLMKVHAPQPAPLTSPRSNHQGPRPSPPNASVHEPKSMARIDAKPQLPNGDAGARAADILASKLDAAPKEPGLEARSWSSMQPQTSGQFSNWSASTMATHSPQGGSLWGPPSNHRALGNGDFQSNIQRTSLNPGPPSFSGQSSSNPQPIGTPRHFAQQHPTRPTASSNKSDLLAGAIIEDLQSVPAFPSEPDALAQGHQPHSEEPADARTPAGPHHMQGSTPNAMSSVHQQQPLDSSKTAVAAWSHFSQNSGRHEAEKAAQEHAARMADQQLGLARPVTLPTLNETWKQVKRGDSQGTRQVIATTHVTNNYAPSNLPQGVDFNKTIAPPTGGLHARSRYQDIFDHQHRSATSTPPAPRPMSPTSAPPPDSAEHPAFGLDKRPLVNLPSARPRSPEPSKPVVKLPPPKELPPVAPRTASRQISYSNVVKITSAGTNWQDRFDTLFDRETKAPSSPVLPASKPHFDSAPAGKLTAVSLPAASVEDGSSLLSSTAEEEEALFEEERAFGSTPTIRVPSKAAVEVWSMAPLPDYKKFPTNRLRDDQVTSVRQDWGFPGDDFRHPTTSILIYLPGMPTSQSKPFSRKQPGSHRVSKSSHRLKPRGGTKSRDAFHGTPRVVSAEASTGTTTSSGASKGKSGFGGRHTSFNRRASGVAS